jgi:hypothetical protein
MNLLKRTTAFAVVTVLLGTAGCGQSNSDEAITGRVKTAISSEPGLKGTKVSVATNEKVVHLKGTVKTRAERAMLIAAARKVDGVKAVKTDLEVAAPKTAPKAQRTVAKTQPKSAAKTRTAKVRTADRPTSQY